MPSLGKYLITKHKTKVSTYVSLTRWLMISVFGTSPSVFEQLSEWWGKSISIHLLAFTSIQAGAVQLITPTCQRLYIVRHIWGGK